MIFGFLTVAEKITHDEASRRIDLRSKRMGNRVPNGNIIVCTKGGYDRFDGGAHHHIFEKIKRHYVIGSKTESRMLTADEIGRLAPEFIQTLSSIVGIHGRRAIDIISRKGRVLTSGQVKSLLTWLNDS